jgi:RNA polymerase sigma-70 factor (ECF subfamily)
MVMDTELVTRAQRGDEAAFAKIVEAVTDRFLAVSHRILHDAQLAEDATQQALVKLWKHLPRLRDANHFEAWSYQLVVKACYSEARRHRRWRSDVSLHVSGQPSVPDDIGHIVARDQLEHALRRISVEHRAVLVLRYYVDLPLEEVAVALDIPSGTVKSRLHRAHQTLRGALEAGVRPVSLPTRSEASR